MSASDSPNNNTTFQEEELVAAALDDRHSFPMTLAIVKNHALNHRFDIETRIQEQGFEIVKERQMEFDTETDPDTLYELFGQDTPSLAEGPVWVYVLERRNPVQAWLSLMGPEDPSVARQTSPSSLRALYGLSLEQNAVMGSPDDQLAEIQIASLFASSPPFPTSDLPDTASSRFNSLRSVSSSVLSALRKGNEDEGYARSDPSNGSGGSGGLTPRLGANGKPLFRARPIPNTHLTPSIQPRTTRSAALRAGAPVDKLLNSPRGPISPERLAKTFANVPGHKRAEVIPVASTAPPVVAPRMTKAASLRLGQKIPEMTRRKADPNKDAFEGVPGHKRRESISVASTAPPSVAPRTNKSAHLRTQGGPPPSSFMFKVPTAPKLPGRSRSQNGMNMAGGNIDSRPSSVQSNAPNSISNPGTLRRQPTALASYSGHHHQRPSISTAHSSDYPLRNSSVALSLAGSSSAIVAGATGEPEDTSRPKPKPRVSSVMAPSIAPRTNRSALLRAAKMEAQETAATATTKVKGRPKALPSARAVFA